MKFPITLEKLNELSKKLEELKPKDLEKETKEILNVLPLAIAEKCGGKPNNSLMYTLSTFHHLLTKQTIFNAFKIIEDGCDPAFKGSGLTLQSQGEYEHAKDLISVIEYSSCHSLILANMCLEEIAEAKKVINKSSKFFDVDFVDYGLE